MRAFSEPEADVIELTDCVITASDQKGFNISGDGGTSGGIREIGDDEAGNGSAF